MFYILAAIGQCTNNPPAARKMPHLTLVIANLGDEFHFIIFLVAFDRSQLVMQLMVEVIFYSKNTLFGLWSLEQPQTALLDRHTVTSFNKPTSPVVVDPGE